MRSTTPEDSTPRSLEPGTVRGTPCPADGQNRPETVHLWGALHFAVRFDLRGTPQEIFGEAYRIGQAYLLLRGRSIPPGGLKFFAWAYAKRDKMAEELDYVPMPKKIVGEIEKVWASEIKDPNGKLIYLD
jgi:hypothetical protein